VAPGIRDAPTGHTQLRTRPPTDDAVLRRPPTAPDRRHSGESRESRGAEGTLIHHAPTRAIGPLPVAMIKAAFRTVLVTATRRAHTDAPGLVATRRRAVDVSAIAGRTDAKGLGTCAACPHPKRRLHEAAAPSARPRPSASLSGRMKATGSACRSVESVTRAWRLLLQVLTSLGRAHLISTPPSAVSTPTLPNRLLCLISR
jgi:hypothetical protein